MGLAAPTPSTVIPDRATVMETLVDLVAHLEELGEDEIDGEFYWRCCRTDLTGQIADLRDAYPIPDSVSGAGDGAVFSRALFAYLSRARELASAGADARFAGAVSALERRLRAAYPDPVFERLLAGMRVPMRVPEVALHVMDGVPCLRMSVYSGSWTGTDVEDAFRKGARLRHNIANYVMATYARGAASDDRWAGDERRSRVVQGSTSVTFRLVTDPADAFTAGRGAVRVPCIEVVAHPPLPDAGDLARAYDEKAREANRLHESLPGRPTRREKEVALRTWAVGLLTAGGTDHKDAMRDIAKAMNREEVSQARFTEDRLNLLSRVPEATPYLYARGSRARPLT